MSGERRSIIEPALSAAIFATLGESTAIKLKIEGLFSAFETEL